MTEILVSIVLMTTRNLPERIFAERDSGSTEVVIQQTNFDCREAVFLKEMSLIHHHQTSHSSQEAWDLEERKKVKKRVETTNLSSSPAYARELHDVKEVL